MPSILIKIGKEAFRGQPLTSISFPNSLRAIGGRAFEEAKLTSVVIPNGVTHVGLEAFRNNANLTSVVIPPSLANYKGTWLTTSEGFQGAFYGCSIARITLPANVNTDNISSNGFQGDNAFRDAYVGNGRKAGTYVWTGRIWRVE